MNPGYDEPHLKNSFIKFLPMKKKLPFKSIDLTHTLSPRTPFWDGSCGFNHKIDHDYHQYESEVKFRTHDITMHAGIGTHIDAPSHCIEGGANIDDLELDSLISPSVVIDVSQKADADYRISVSDIKEFENRYNAIPIGAFVIFYTGWERFWNDAEKYHNNHLFPSVSKDAASYLLEKEISGLGIDTLSPDKPIDRFPVHKLVLGANKYIVENVANARNLPPTGAYTLALPMKMEGVTESPIRLIGISIE